MAETLRKNRMGHTVRDYWPDDTDDSFYVEVTTTMADILERATAKWGTVDLTKLLITAEHVHTKYLGYDLYDPTDWTNFLCITRNK
jgi:hypothetical protein